MSKHQIPKEFATMLIIFARQSWYYKLKTWHVGKLVIHHLFPSSHGSTSSYNKLIISWLISFILISYRWFSTYTSLLNVHMSVCVTMQLRCGLKKQEIKYNYIINFCEFTLHFVYQYLKYSLKIHEETAKQINTNGNMKRLVYCRYG